MLHRHVWKITHREKQPSIVELAGDRPWNAKGIPDPTRFFSRPVIVTYECDRCGTVKVVRV